MTYTAAATAEQVAAYRAGKQHRWKCPSCEREINVLDALMVACSVCEVKLGKLVWMERIDVNVTSS